MNRLSRWLLDLSSPNNPINKCALSLSPRLSLFSEVNCCVVWELILELILALILEGEM